MVGLLFIIASLFLSINNMAKMLVGTAFDTEGNIIYREYHSIKSDEFGLSKHIFVEYKNLQGESFATMISDFSKNKLVPDVVFEDKRFQTKHLARTSNGKVFFEKLKNGILISSETHPLDGLLVLGQGFDNFIRSYSKKLELSSLSFQFGVLRKMSFYSLIGHKRDSNSSHEIHYGINAGNWFLRLFVKELKLVYEAQTGRLKSFTGQSNLVNEQGEPYNVHIQYEWVDGS